MAKKKETPINKIPIPNELHIKTCSICKGKPKVSPINLPDFDGEKCDDCFHVISFKKKKK